MGHIIFPVFTGISKKNAIQGVKKIGAYADDVLMMVSGKHLLTISYLMQSANEAFNICKTKRSGS